MSEEEEGLVDIVDRARAAFNNNEFTKAVDLFSQALSTDPSNVELLVCRAHAHIKAENYPAGKKDANSAIDLARSERDPERWKEHIFKAFLRSGVASFHMGKYEEAKNCFLQGQKEPLADEKGIRQWVYWCEEKMEKLKAKRGGGAVESETTPETKPDSKPAEAALATSAQKLAKVKYDFYQTEAQLVLEIRIKGLKGDDVKVEFQTDRLLVEVNNVNETAYGVKQYNLKLKLAHPVVSEKCSFRVMSTKVEIRLAKRDGIRWGSLESETTTDPVLPAATSTPTTLPTQAPDGKSAGGVRPPAYPSSRPGARNWDRIEKDIEAELAEEKPEGEQALNELFQKIYRDADDDTRRAMNKSFQESGGTVLSTNWADIKKEKTEVKPPDGMEYKKW